MRALNSVEFRSQTEEPNAEKFYINLGELVSTTKTDEFGFIGFRANTVGTWKTANGPCWPPRSLRV